MRPEVGANMFAYRNNGTPTVPVWNLVSMIEDLAINNLARTLAEIKIRASSFTSNLPALIDTIKVEFKHYYGMDATTCTALINLFFLGSIEEWLFADAPVTVNGAQGLRCPMIVSELPVDQNIEEAAAFNVGLSTGYMESPPGTRIDPSWFIVAGGSSTTTTSLP